MSDVVSIGCCCRNSTKIFVGNIKIGTTSDELHKIFQCHGSVTDADVIGGYGFVVSNMYISL